MKSNGFSSSGIRWRISLFLLASMGTAVAVHGCGEVPGSNLVWFEATAGSNAIVVSQGPGRTLTLACDNRADGTPCKWTVRMLLRSGEALRSWSQSFLGESSSALLKVNSFNYVLTGFTTPAGGESFGAEPDLLSGAGASTDIPDGVAAGNYTLLQFELEFSNPINGPAVRTILTAFGDTAWAGTDPDDDIPPIVQVGPNFPLPALAGALLPAPVIIVDNTVTDGPGAEFCGDGRDNDGDGRTDCRDSDCDHHPLCDDDDDEDDDGRRPSIDCPADLTVECDGAGNTTAVQTWLATVDAESSCTGLLVSNDFNGLDDGQCGDAGSSVVRWRATDTCGSASCSANLKIVDTATPNVQGPADLSFVCDESGTQTQLRDWLNSASSTDVCGSTTVVFARGATTLNCSGAVVWTAEDDCGNTATDTAQVTIQGDTEAPRMTLNGPATLTLECGVDAYTELGATVADDCDATLTGPAIGGSPVNTREPGVYVLNYDAVDLCNHAAPRLIRTVTVVDTRGPRVELRPVELWPPDHHYVTLHLSDCARLMDDCEGELDLDEIGTILSVASSEADDANGDGNTVNDIVVVDHSTFRARAERQGGGDGRTYSVRFEAVNGLSQRIEATCLVDVPHDQSGHNDDDNDEEDEGDDH